MDNHSTSRWQITIDGKAATGKTSCGRLLAAKLQFALLDTGFYYRYLTWLAIKLSIDLKRLNANNLARLLAVAEDDYQYELAKQRFIHQQVEITKQLFAPIIAECLNYLTPLPAIRNFVTQICRKQMVQQNTILVGRDCGTNIAPQALIKFFFTTACNVRNERRIQQIRQDNQQEKLEKIIKTLQTRNLQDEQRQMNPVKPAHNALIIDNTDLTIEQTMHLVYGQVQKSLQNQVPQIMLLGPPNVGKSTIFNALIKQKQSLVSAEILTTRDVVQTIHKFGSQIVNLVDAGGMTAENHHPFEKLITQQNRQLMKKTSLFLLVFDVNTPYTESVKWYFNQIKKYAKPIIIILNKIDRKPELSQITGYWQLGVPNLVTLAAKTKHNLQELNSLIGQLIAQDSSFELQSINLLGQTAIKVGILGQTNVGKSTFFNRLIGSNLAIVSPIEHTTTNSVRHTVWYQKNYFTFWDTAGLRRKWKKSSRVEKQAKLQIMQELNQLDIGIFLLDGSQAIVEQDKRIIRFLLEQNLPLMIVVNKIDLITGKFPHQTAILQNFPHLKRSAVIYCNSLHLKNHQQIFKHLLAIHQEKTRLLTAKQKRLLIKKLNFLLAQKQIDDLVSQVVFTNGSFTITVSKNILKKPNIQFLFKKCILENIHFRFLNPNFILKIEKNI